MIKIPLSLREGKRTDKNKKGLQGNYTMEMKNMTFFEMKPFEANKRRNRRAHGISCTICENTVILNKETYEAFEEPDYVEVGFNEAKHFFGIRPVREETKYSVPVLNCNHSHMICRNVICEKIEDILPFNRKKNNLILERGNYDSESGYWLFDIDSGLIVQRGKRETHVR